MSLALRATALVACLLSGVVARAVPVIYDFTATGSVCAYGVNSVCTPTHTGAFTGTVTVDMLASGPSGPDSSTDGSTFAYDRNGWAQSDFLIQWGAGESFNPAPLAVQTSSENGVQVLNDYNSLIDQLANYESYSWTDGTNVRNSFAELNRGGNASWLSDLSFATKGLAPGYNQITFSDTYSTPDGIVGFYGQIFLDSLTVRGTTSVPEPGTLALFAIGIAALGFARRRYRAMG